MLFWEPRPVGTLDDGPAIRERHSVAESGTGTQVDPLVQAVLDAAERWSHASEDADTDCYALERAVDAYVKARVPVLPPTRREVWTLEFRAPKKGERYWLDDACMHMRLAYNDHDPEDGPRWSVVSVVEAP